MEELPPTPASLLPTQSPVPAQNDLQAFTKDAPTLADFGLGPRSVDPSAPAYLKAGRIISPHTEKTSWTIPSSLLAGIADAAYYTQHFILTAKAEVSVPLFLVCLTPLIFVGLAIHTKRCFKDYLTYRRLTSRITSRLAWQINDLRTELHSLGNNYPLEPTLIQSLDTLLEHTTTQVAKTAKQDKNLRRTTEYESSIRSEVPISQDRLWKNQKEADNLDKDCELALSQSQDLILQVRTLGQRSYLAKQHGRMLTATPLAAANLALADQIEHLAALNQAYAELTKDLTPQIS